MIARAPVAIVEAASAHAVREINALEGRIAQAEDDADAQLWEQARLVVAQLDAGLSQRRLAAQWINARTGQPYDEKHVRLVRRVWASGAELTPHRPFRALYNDLANRLHNQRTCRRTFNPEWYTPAALVEQARAVLGAIDLDPASCEAANAVVRATTFYTKDTDALARPWHGRT